MFWAGSEAGALSEAADGHGGGEVDDGDGRHWAGFVVGRAEVEIGGGEGRLRVSGCYGNGLCGVE